MRRIYLDHNATSPLRPQARAAMLDALDAPRNASSVHAEGRAAKAMLEDARAAVAKAVGTSARNVTFTSGATEAANLALTPHLRAGDDARPFEILLVGAGEHPAVLSGHRFSPEQVEAITLTPAGDLSLPALEAALEHHAGRRILLALQAANNETGAIQPVRAAAERVRAAGGRVICDATQAMGRIEGNFIATGADLLFFSSHKLGGPAGAGALAVASDDFFIDAPLIRGGGQEFGRRAGTENLAAIAGFAAALTTALSEQDAEAARLTALRDRLEEAIIGFAPDAVFFSQSAARLPNTSAFALPGLNAQTVLMALDLAGAAISSGSACSSGKVRESHVLAAMGAVEKTALRVSLGWTTTPEDIDEFVMVLESVVSQIRSRRSPLDR
jgi:cysteine desulfurase